MNNIKEAVPILRVLLNAEISQGNAPGSVSPGINDAPEQVKMLIEKIERDCEGNENDREFRILVGSVLGGYLGRPELFRAHDLGKVTPSGFEQTLRQTLLGLIELANVKTVSY